MEKTEIAFVINVFDETPDQVEYLIQSIKKFYVGSPIFVLYDGVKQHCHSGVTEIASNQLKLPGKFGSWTHRYLETYLEKTNLPYLIKLDPDTNVLGKIKNLPNSEKATIFCRMTTDYVPHGGSIGYTRPIVQEIIKNKWLLDENKLIYHKNSQWQDHMMKQLIIQERIHVQVRRDFGWTGFETKDTVFSHDGTSLGRFGPYVMDQNVK